MAVLLVVTEAVTAPMPSTASATTCNTMTAAHLQDGMPPIDVEIKPYEADTEMHMSFDIVPKEARRWPPT